MCFHGCKHHRVLVRGLIHMISISVGDLLTQPRCKIPRDHLYGNTCGNTWDHVNKKRTKMPNVCHEFKKNTQKDTCQNDFEVKSIDATSREFTIDTTIYCYFHVTI